jgi:hypothetical protein
MQFNPTACGFCAEPIQKKAAKFGQHKLRALRCGDEVAGSGLGVVGAHVNFDGAT